MANNNFKPFAAAAGANVMAQADYEALAALLTGFQSGTAQSAQLNKVWRQSSIMAAVLGQFIVDLTGQDAVDDGTTATLLANLKMAVQAQSAAVVGQVRNLRMSVTTASNTATLNADEIVVGTALGGQKYLLKQFSKTINLAAAGAGGMDTGTSPVSTWVAIYLIYNPSTGASALLGYNTGSNVAPEVYGGANMPAGYTASALVSIVATNPSGQLKPFIQMDRKVAFAGIGVFNSTTDASSFQPISLIGVVPPNAKTAGGYGDVSVTVGGVTNFAFASDATGIGNQTFNSSSESAYGHSLVWTDIPLAVQQTIYIYRAATLNGSGTRQYTAYCSSYTF
ncbi:hypothetical protein [Burkholderia multivorans]|uniref:hypothetical protein n=1 Tax=Burkholderia multivorans TaxID=87883 RepID=UPI0021BFD911|nr:hypothetical protein [Burkholderia multivorans]